MITMISGLPRVGKTALGTAFAIERMFYSDDIFSCRQQLKEMNKGGFAYELPKTHLVYSDYYIKGSCLGLKPKKNHYINGFELALPNSDFETAFIPPYSFVVLDEAQKYFNSRKKGLSDYVCRFFEMHGHNNLNILLICLRLGQVDLNIRSHAERVIQVLSLKHKFDRFGDIKESTWSGLEFESCYQAEQYREGGSSSDKGKPFIYTFCGDIFSCYNSYNHRALHYKDRYDLQFDMMPGVYSGLTKQSMKDYNAVHRIEAPKGFYKEK